MQDGDFHENGAKTPTIIVIGKIWPNTRWRGEKFAKSIMKYI